MEQGLAARLPDREKPVVEAPQRLAPCIPVELVQQHDVGPQFLQDRIKVEGKTGVLGEHVKVVATKSKVQVTTSVPMAKRYLKYLTKKFLKKHQVRDWLRVLASNTKGERNTYELKYFKLNEEDEDSEEEE